LPKPLRCVALLARSKPGHGNTLLHCAYAELVSDVCYFCGWLLLHYCLPAAPVLVCSGPVSWPYRISNLSGGSRFAHSSSSCRAGMVSLVGRTGGLTHDVLNSIARQPLDRSGTLSRREYIRRRQQPRSAAFPSRQMSSDRPRLLRTGGY